MQIATRSDYEVFVAHLYQLSRQIGIRPAARALGIPEDRARKIAERRKFNISLKRANPFSVTKVTEPIEATENVIQHYGDRAKISATIAGAKALEHLADSNPENLVKTPASIAADQWTKAVDRAAGWTQSRQQGVVVNVAAIVPPSEAERAQRKATHAKLDEITALLRAPSP